MSRFGSPLLTVVGPAEARITHREVVVVDEGDGLRAVRELGTALRALGVVKGQRGPSYGVRAADREGSSTGVDVHVVTRPASIGAEGELRGAVGEEPLDATYRRMTYICSWYL